MDNPLDILNSVGDAATGAVRKVGTGVTGIVGKVNNEITSILDKPPILGKYGPHKAADRLVRGTLNSINTSGNGLVAGMQAEGHTMVDAVKTPGDQLSNGMKRR